MFLKGCFFMSLTLEGFGGIESTNFEYFSIQKVVVALKGLIFKNFHF